MKSIENIHEITKAMEMIAGFRFKRAENRFSKSKFYFGEMERMVLNLCSSVMDAKTQRAARLPPACRQAGNGQASPRNVFQLFDKRKIQKKTLVVMTGDKGLCGAYNANLLKMAASWLKENNRFETGLVAVGKVAVNFFKKRHMKLMSDTPEKSMVDLELAKKITTELKTLFLSGKTDSVELLYTPFRAGGTGQNVFKPFLSLNTLMDSVKPDAELYDYIYEPGFEAVFISLLEKYLEGKMYVCLLESLTSEYNARRVAMKQATENGEEVLDNLRLLRNKTRQATITRELSEIVSGASVLV